jgi:hypothetical protein
MTISKRRNKKITYGPRDTDNISGPYLFFLISPLSLQPSHPPVHHCPHFVIPHCQLLAHDPPCEQWLTGLGQVLGCSCHWACRLTATVVGCRCPSFIIILPLLPIIPVLGCSPFHPMSSCSKWQLRVLLWCLILIVCHPIIHLASSGGIGGG